MNVHLISFEMEEHRRFWLLKKKQTLLKYIISRRHARRIRTTWARKIFKERESHGAFYTLIPKMRDMDALSFQHFLKVTPTQLDEIVNLVSLLLQKHDTNFRRAITPKEKVCLTLRYLASGDTRRSLSLQFRLGYSTTSVIIGETCAALWTALSPLLMKSPENVSAWGKIAEDFQKKWNFPNCLGAVGGRHVRVQATNAPTDRRDENSCSENDTCTVMIAVCDANCMFRAISVDDLEHRCCIEALERSEFGKSLASGQMPTPPSACVSGSDACLPYVFLADDVYHQNPCLLRPYAPKKLNTRMRIFNYRFNRARGVLENSFGILTARWGVLQKPITAKASTVSSILKACCVLHNFILMNNKDFTADYESIKGVVLGSWRSGIHGDDTAFQPLASDNGQYSSQAASVRDSFADYFVSEAGSKDIPWQYNKISREET